MTDKPISPEILRRWRGTAARLNSYTAVLETAAGKYEKDRSKSAHEAIAATVTFLVALKKPRHLLAPLVEAAEIIQRHELEKGVVTKEVAEKVIQSIAVTLQINAKVGMNEALRKVVGNDPSAAKSLKYFRTNMLSKDIPKGAKAYYNATMKSDFNGLDPKGAVKKALIVCAHMRGKEA